jgi:SAM-dependent methyltransferase
LKRCLEATIDPYSELAPDYHLIYDDWDEGMERQADALDRIVRTEWGSHTTRLLDAACGIGTQALGLAALGYDVWGSDVSLGAVARAEQEAARRRLPASFAVADLRQVAEVFAGHAFDVVLACDNALPHLLSDGDILEALRQLYRLLRPGGGCLLSVRDYAEIEPCGPRLVPHGVREVDGRRYVLYQVWDFDGPYCDVAFHLTVDRGEAGATTKVLRWRVYRIEIRRLSELMAKAGFVRVHRIDGVYFQPVLVGTRPE